jgi:peptide/nickel transport system ATP-binding protein
VSIEKTDSSAGPAPRRGADKRVRRGRPDCSGRAGRELRDSGGRDTRAGRRVGKWQVGHDAALQDIRGGEIGLVPQDPDTALNPVFTIGDQIVETMLAHKVATRRDVHARMLELLDAVRMPDAARRARDYPHQLSGGLRQRAMVALGLAGDPALLIADEPTTGLDAPTQARIVELLRELVERRGLAMLSISHDLDVVATCADQVAVMCAGEIVEQGPTRMVLDHPRPPLHPRLGRLGPGSHTRHTARDDRGNPARSGRERPRVRFRAAMPGTIRTL